MRIIFYSNRIKFNGDFLENKGLGGSESALINISTVWKKIYPEDEIIVLNGSDRNSNERLYEGIHYLPVYERRLYNCDVFISLRDYYPFISNDLFSNAKLKCFWSQDDMSEIGLQISNKNKYIFENIDLIFAISNYACNNISKNFEGKKVELLRNGYRKEWIKQTNEYREPIAIYTSTPFRGLDVLSEVWEHIFIKCKEDYNIEPKLKIFTGMSLYNQSDNAFVELYNKLRFLPNVDISQPIPQKKLYDELKKCRVMLYPNHFLETGCMSVLEAIANGVWIVTTDLGALNEQVTEKTGFLIKGDARSDSYKSEFIHYAVKSIIDYKVPDGKDLVFSWDEQAVKMRKIIMENL